MKPSTNKTCLKNDYLLVDMVKCEWTYNHRSRWCAVFYGCAINWKTFCSLLFVWKTFCSFYEINEINILQERHKPLCLSCVKYWKWSVPRPCSLLFRINGCKGNTTSHQYKLLSIKVCMAKESLTNEEVISPYYDRFLQSWEYLKQNNFVKFAST